MPDRFVSSFTLSIFYQKLFAMTAANQENLITEIKFCALFRNVCAAHAFVIIKASKLAKSLITSYLLVNVNGCERETRHGVGLKAGVLHLINMLCVTSDKYLPVRAAYSMNEKHVTPSYWVLFIALPAIIAGVIVITFKFPLWLWAAFIVLLLIVGEHGLKKWTRFLSNKKRIQ